MTPRTLAVTDLVSVTGLSALKDNHYSKPSNKPSHEVFTQRSIMDHPCYPVFLWDFLVFIWTFRKDSVVQTWNDYSETISREYYAAQRAYRFGYRKN